METLDPGAFTGSEAAGDAGKSPAHSNAGSFLYYSFVTLTTLGFGDVTPRSDAARSLSVLEALVGQLYLATLIAALVGTMIAQRTMEPGDRAD